MKKPDGDDVPSLPQIGRRRVDFGVIEALKLIITVWTATSPLLAGLVWYTNSVVSSSQSAQELTLREKYVTQEQYRLEKVEAQRLLTIMNEQADKDHDLLVKIAENLGVR